MIIQTHTGLYQ